MKTKKVFLVFAAVLGISILGVGCGKSTEEEAEPKVEYETVGEQTEDAYDILLTNATGNVITGLSVKGSSEQEYPANMMGTDQKIEADETIEFFYMSADQTDTSETAPNETTETEGAESADSSSQADESEQSAPISDALINETYSLQVTFEDGTVKELSNFAVDDMEEADLMYEEEVIFVKYTSLSENVEINTKETEFAIQADKDAAQVVSDQIQAIGEVTLDSESVIVSARTAYDALTDSQKQYVTNAQLLTEQESELTALKQAAADQAAAEAEAAAQTASDAASQSWSDQSSGYSDYGYSNYGYSDPGYDTSESSASDSMTSGVDQSADNCLGDVLINN